MDYKKFRLFKVEKKILIFNYQLLLPISMQLYLIFHILLLKLVLEGTQIDKPHLHIKVHKEVFKVEAILDK